VADEYIQDGETIFTGGQDASKIPSKLQPGFVSAAVNTSFSNGVPQPRWAAVKRKVIPPEGDLVNLTSNFPTPFAQIYYGGRFQAGIPYTLGGDEYAVIVIAGQIFLVNLNTFVAKLITIQGGGNLNEFTPRLNWSNAGKFLVIFDYPNYPVVFDGITAKRSSSYTYGIPVSTIGAFNQSRLFIGNNGNEYTAGDPVGNPATPDAPVTFEEVLAPAANFLGQFFQLPTAYANNTTEKITAMTFLQQTDSSTGIGPLIIATKNQVFSIQSQLPRAQWQPLGQPSQFASLFVHNAGIAGPRAVVNVNSDLFFLSNDGQVRSAAMSRQEQGKWARVPISREVQNWLKYWDQSLVEYTAMGYFKNKIFCTANPYRVKAYDTNRNPIYDVCFGGFVSLSTDNLATLSDGAPPSWDGLWTPCRPMEFITINNRFFVMSKDEGSRNELYEIFPEQTYDFGDDNVRQIKSVIYTREYDFKSPFQNKDLYSFNFGLENVRGEFSFDVSFKPSHGTQFLHWGEFLHDAPWRNCNVPMDCSINGLAPHNFKNLVMGSPDAFESCDPVNKLQYGNMRKAQLRFVIEGVFWQLQEYVINAKVTPENKFETICTPASSTPVSVCVDCNTLDWAIGPFESCHQSQQTL